MRSDWIEAVGKISTHPPVKGGTLRRTGMDSYIKISTHPPVKGGTANLCIFLHKVYIIRW